MTVNIIIAPSRYYLLTTVFLWTTLTGSRQTTSAGIRGLGQGTSTLPLQPLQTIAKTFIYNPPSNSGPPPDVLAMLASGKTSGFRRMSGIKDFVNRKVHHHPHLATLNPFPSEDRLSSVDDPQHFQGLLLQDYNHDAALTWESTRDENEPTLEVVKLAPDQIHNADLSEYSTTQEIQGGMPDVGGTVDTETLIVSSTDYQTVDLSTTFPDLHESSTDFPGDIISMTDGESNFESITLSEEEEEDFSTTEYPVEAMTQDDEEGESTTLTPVILDYNSDSKEKYTEETKEQTKNWKDISDIIQKIIKKSDDKHSKENEGKKEARSENDELLGEEMMNVNYHDGEKATESGSRFNSIFFTIDDSAAKNGHISVKLGKALEYGKGSSNTNTILKNNNDIYQYNFQDPNTGWYKFGYGDTHQWRHEERRDDGIVLGRYGWHDANGKEHSTHFVADAKGYRIVHPGQEITMHVALPTASTNPPIRQTGNPSESTSSTVRPISTHKPTYPPSSSTTASFPITSLSTTLTLSTRPSNNPNRPPPPPYPGSIDELIDPDQELTVVTGRPPIAYPLPHESVAHQPGSWVFVAPTPFTQGTNRPYIRPAYRPYRPYPNRPIKSPFRPVNRPRPKPNRVKPLKPLQPNLNKYSKPQEDSEEENASNPESSNQKPVKDNNEEEVSKPTINEDFIAQLQAFLKNPSKYSSTQSSQPLTDEPPTPSPSLAIPNYQAPSKKPFTSDSPDLNPIETDNTSNLTPGELMHFVSLINSLKMHGQKPATSVSDPELSMSPWSSTGIKFPPILSSTNSNVPSFNLKPPPPIPHSSTQDFSGSSIHEAYEGGQQHIHYPLDYAFMDEDYAIMGLTPVIHSSQNIPAHDTKHTQSLFNIPELSGTGMSTSNENGDEASNEYVGSVTWKIPGAVPVKVFHPGLMTSQSMGWDISTGSTEDDEGLSTQGLGKSTRSTTPLSTTSMSSPKPSITSLKPPPSSTTEESNESSIWPYISTQSSVVSPSTSSTPPDANKTTIMPPTPPPQSIWEEFLNRIYYWPNTGPLKNPTTIQ